MADSRDRVDPMSVLRRHLDGGVPLTRAAAEAGVPIRTARRWLAVYRAHGSEGLHRKQRSDRGRPRRLSPEVLALIAEHARSRPGPITRIHADVADSCRENGWAVPSYSTVRSALIRMGGRAPGTAEPHNRVRRSIPPPRPQPARPAAPSTRVWAAGRTNLDLVIRRADGGLAWCTLTTVIDLDSFAVTGFSVGIGQPSPAHTRLALRRSLLGDGGGDGGDGGVRDRDARRRPPKTFIPDYDLRSDYDLESDEDALYRVCRELGIRLVPRATAARSHESALEHFFQSVHTALEPVRQWVSHGAGASTDLLSWRQVEEFVHTHINYEYHRRSHPETGRPPLLLWRSLGQRRRGPLPEEALARLLPHAAEPHTVHRDGVRFRGRRYFDRALLPLAGRTVELAFDPSDCSVVHVFRNGRLHCRATDTGHGAGAAPP